MHLLRHTPFLVDCLDGVALVDFCQAMGHSRGEKQKDTPLQIAKKRLAKGDIATEQLLELRKTLII